MREKILAIIEKNSRIDLKDLAALLGESEAAVANEIADMEKENIICGYHTMINWDNTGNEKVIALIEVKVTPQRGMGFDKIAERIYQYSEVNSVYLMSGAFDFTVIIEERLCVRSLSLYLKNFPRWIPSSAQRPILYSRNIRTTARSCMRSRGMKG